MNPQQYLAKVTKQLKDLQKQANAIASNDSPSTTGTDKNDGDKHDKQQRKYNRTPGLIGDKEVPYHRYYRHLNIEAANDACARYRDWRRKEIQWYRGTYSDKWRKDNGYPKQTPWEKKKNGGWDTSLRLLFLLN